MSLETSRAAAFIANLLSNDSALHSLGVTGVYDGVGDEDVTSPYIVFNRMSAVDKLNVNAHRLHVSMVYSIKVIGLTATYVTLQAIADRIDALLGLTSGTAGGAIILSCYREQAYDLTTVVGGQKWSELGGIYRLQVQMP